MAHADIIEAFLTLNDKALVGMPNWVEQPRAGELMATWQIEADGVITENFEVRALAYPNVARTLQPYFKLGLFYLKTPVCRLDFQRDKTHFNQPHRRPPHVPPGMVQGEHWHDFADNKFLFEAAKMPTRFQFAVAPPHRITRFEQAFHWFCDTINTARENHQVVDLPVRTRLL